MEKRLVGRGLLAAQPARCRRFARICAEPVIGRAIAFEDGRADAENAHGVHEHGAELFTRGVQANAGLGFRVLIFGLAIWAPCLRFCVVASRTRVLAVRQLSLLLAPGAFGAVYLVPFVKYPPNPPAVGQADTIRARTGWYLVMVLASVAPAFAAVWLARRLDAGFGRVERKVACDGGLRCCYRRGDGAVTGRGRDETPEPMRDASGAIFYPGFPADVVNEFRLLSLATQLVLWVSIGVVFATLAGRLLEDRTPSIAA